MKRNMPKLIALILLAILALPTAAFAETYEAGVQVGDNSANTSVSYSDQGLKGSLVIGIKP